MILLLMLVVVLVAATGWLVAHAVVLPRWRLGQHLQQIDQYGFPADPAGAATMEQRGGLGRVAFERLGGFTSGIVPRLRPLEQGELSAAGLYVSPQTVHGVRAFLALALPALVLLASSSLGLTNIVLMLAACVSGWELPMLIIRQRGRARLNAIDRDLPKLIDVLIATIEAGMGFAASLQLVSSSISGPLGAELKLMQREQALGSSTEQALENLVSRCDTPSVRAFSRSLLHAQELGVSIGPMLRNLAEDIRRRRRQSAREKVQKAPIKMLFPLALLIFPPLLIVLLYPAVYQILHSLSNT